MSSKSKTRGTKEVVSASLTKLTELDCDKCVCVKKRKLLMKHLASLFEKYINGGETPRGENLRYLTIYKKDTKENLRKL